MAWSWSHTQDAYANAYANVRKLDRKALVTIFAEWQAYGPGNETNDFDEQAYGKAIKNSSIMSDEQLQEHVWERMSEHATCDNGGFNAWACPYGCHTVPFDPTTKGEDE
jgi:hypothetical protein